MQMNKENIEKAFEGRWRFMIDDHPHDRYLYKKVKALCRDFFEAGILLSELSGGSCSVRGCTAAASLPPPASTAFLSFWNLYDKKVARPKCEKLWEKLTLKEKQACLSYIPLYKQAQPDKQYRKNPETFLRNKSWNDELIFRNHGQQPDIEQQRADKLASILTD